MNPFSYLLGMWGRRWLEKRSPKLYRRGRWDFLIGVGALGALVVVILVWSSFN